VNRAQRKSDRRKLIADLDAALARETALAETNAHLRRIIGERDRAHTDLANGVRRVLDRITTEGASIEEVAEELVSLTVPAQVARELRLVDNHEPRTGLHLIRQRTGGGTR
jgi:hypothetical protein